MDYNKNYEYLHDKFHFNHEKKKLSHSRNVNAFLLPFTNSTQRPDFANAFSSIVGEFARLELSKKWDNDLNLNSIVHEILNSDSLDLDDENEKYMEKMLNEYLFNENDEMNILNPYLFNYVPLSRNKRAVGEREIALFIRDVLAENNENLRNFFKKSQSKHAVVNLILNSIPELSDENVEKKYSCVLNNITKLFNEDMNFAVKNDKFLINNISNIFAFYYFTYITQFILKHDKYDINEIEKVYYILDWESVNINRRTIQKGYNRIKFKTNYLVSSVILIDQLNILLGTEALMLNDLYYYFDDLSAAGQKEFLDVLKRWINDYRYVRSYPEVELNDDFKELVNILFESLNGENGINSQTKSVYAINYTDFGRRFFLKSRGVHGFVLNITREMLFSITALCIKDEKIKLNDMFKEYEKRGIYFDRYSKMEVVDYLSKLNLIDKKSDSGDAQYVKSIL